MGGVGPPLTPYPNLALWLRVCEPRFLRNDFLNGNFDSFGSQIGENNVLRVTQLKPEQFERPHAAAIRRRLTNRTALAPRAARAHDLLANLQRGESIHIASAGELSVQDVLSALARLYGPFETLTCSSWSVSEQAARELLALREGRAVTRLEILLIPACQRTSRTLRRHCQPSLTYSPPRPAMPKFLRSPARPQESPLFPRPTSPLTREPRLSAFQPTKTWPLFTEGGFMEPSKPLNAAIIGSRTLTPTPADIEMELSRLPAPVAAIITGGARGADMAAEAYARAAGIGLTIIRPDYRRYGRGAPLVRNKQIIDLADVVLAFWDGHSRGTAQALDYARKQHKEVRLCQTSTNLLGQHLRPEGLRFHFGPELPQGFQEGGG